MFQVTDGCRALLKACCWIFALFEDIESYANACMMGNVPRTYIRLDVAHYLKNWAVFFSVEKEGVKKFYMFSIGLLILCQCRIEAKKIIKALLILSMSDKAGEGAPSVKESYLYIKNSVAEKTPGTHVEAIINDTFEKVPDKSSTQEDAEENDISSDKNASHEWISEIRNEVEGIIEEEKGDDLNPRSCPRFSKRLLRVLQTIPVWSCICRNQFGYGRTPASSASVESEFKTIKQQVIPHPVRIDTAVEKLVEYYDGKMKIVEANWNQKEKAVDDETVEIMSNDVSETYAETPHSSPAEEEAEENLSNDISDIPRDTSNTNPTDLTSRINYQPATACIACNDGNYPTDAHMCIKCKRNVHILQGCSVSIECEEGYGEKRLCI